MLDNVSHETKLHHFYHIYCGIDCYGQMNSWRESVSIHMDAIQKHGLIHKLETIHIGLVGGPQERENVKEYLTSINIPFTIVAEQDSGFEQVTQDQLFNFAHENEGHVLYAHTKGSHNFTDQNRSWCKSMIYFNVVIWEEAIRQLKKVDAVGCHWHDFSNQYASHLGGPHTGQRWFAGTFWWSKLNRIRDIGHPPTNGSRWDAEVWIGQMPDITVYDFNRADGPYPGEIVTEW